MSAALVATAVVAGLLIGLSLGALGGGGSVLAVPVLVYLLGQTPAQATTGSLVVVGLTSLLGAVAAHRAGTLLLGRGLVFGVTAVGGAALGARLAAHVPDDVLMAAFSVLLLVVATAMARRQLAARRARARGERTGPRPGFDDPILTLRPVVTCACLRALSVALVATAVGLLTGFLGVGGGFLVVPALVLALGLPMDRAAGTSLVVISITSATALAVRAGSGVQPDWALVGLLTAVAVTAGWAGAHLARRVRTDHLQSGFTGLLVLVAGLTAAQAVPSLL